MSMVIDDLDRPRNWIGTRPPAMAIGAILWVGTIGMLICGVQPVVLGALVNEHRLSSAGLGWATTAEFLTLGIGIIVAGSVLKPRRLRLLALVVTCSPKLYQS